MNDPLASAFDRLLGALKFDPPTPLNVTPAERKAIRERECAFMVHGSATERLAVEQYRMGGKPLGLPLVAFAAQEGRVRTAADVAMHHYINDPRLEIDLQ